ncbi:MAG TPA: UDP-N-acetylglucosamine 4,6-dehydratase (inverting) [Candidatus Bilamarchaeaceae archaeon]|nr:UDP-N-acetylglucosamine 4,6-dehydratase (inverting) [Candidatus Bilamarchaeaceae archaeon]
MSDVLENKVILLTGGTGSFGQKFAETVLEKHNPAALRIYSRGELKQVEMERNVTDERIRFFIGDVRDRKRLSRAMNRVDIVVHAAALKHVPVCEYNPIEAVRTNIDGAINIIDAAIDNGVEKVVALSTDKAVQPVNLYGATKLVAEKLFVQANSYVGGRKTRFSCVRYGNVIGSNGSVIPLFKEQAKKGEITVTDEKMTRFWITLDGGVDLVLKALSIMKGGETFIPRIPSVKITDLADVVAPDAKRKIVGIRPGEKLHEILVTSEEARHTKQVDGVYVIEPEHKYWDPSSHNGGKNLPKDFSYSSDNNDWWLKKEELKKLLQKEGWL